eukprot:30460-Hanusia_phi.AAC.1
MASTCPCVTPAQQEDSESPSARARRAAGCSRLQQAAQCRFQRVTLSPPLALPHPAPPVPELKVRQYGLLRG